MTEVREIDSSLMGTEWLGDLPKKYTFYNGDIELFFDDSIHQYTRYDENGLVVVPGVTSAVGIIDKSGALTQWASNMACGFLRAKVASHRAEGLNWADVTDEQFEEWVEDARFHFRDYKDAAADIGSIAHDWLEDFIKHLIANRLDEAVEMTFNLPEHELARNGVIAALDWMAKHKVRWLVTEEKVYSREHDFAGTMDGLAYVSACGDVDCCKVWDADTISWVPLQFMDALCIVDWKTSNSLHAEYEYQTAAYLMTWNEMHGELAEYRVLCRLGKQDGQFESRLLVENDIVQDFRIFLSCLQLYVDLNSKKQAEKELRDAIKAALKAEKERLIAEERAAKAARKAAIKEVKAKGKTLYKDLRAQKMPVPQAEAEVARFLADELFKITGDETADSADEDIELPLAA